MKITIPTLISDFHFALSFSKTSPGCVYMWERTVMGISVHTAETETATTPYYYS